MKKFASFQFSVFSKREEGRGIGYLLLVIGEEEKMSDQFRIFNFEF
jgi:hypothetical protein